MCNSMIGPSNCFSASRRAIKVWSIDGFARLQCLFLWRGSPSSGTAGQLQHEVGRKAYEGERRQKRRDRGGQVSDGPSEWRARGALHNEYEHGVSGVTSLDMRLTKTHRR